MIPSIIEHLSLPFNRCIYKMKKQSMSSDNTLAISAISQHSEHVFKITFDSAVNLSSFKVDDIVILTGCSNSENNKKFAICGKDDTLDYILVASNSMVAETGSSGVLINKKNLANYDNTYREILDANNNVVAYSYNTAGSFLYMLNEEKDYSCIQIVNLNASKSINYDIKTSLDCIHWDDLPTAVSGTLTGNNSLTIWLDQISKNVYLKLDISSVTSGAEYYLLLS